MVDDRRVVYADDLRRRYEAWCAARGETPLSGQAVGAGLRLQGFERVAGGTKRWLGLGLLDEDPTPATGQEA